jgi:tetratricopeptide (TPR) repeat protein
MLSHHLLTCRRRRPHREEPRRWSLPASLLLPLLLGLLSPTAADPVAPTPLPGPDTGVLRPTDRGTVRGFVIDARTRQPVAGARVVIEEEGRFAETGRSVAHTDAKGRYEAQALIGRSWRKLDWMRLFTGLSPLLLLQPQSVMMQSRTVLTTRLNARVEREGFMPFLGEVRAERLDPGRFLVHLDDVWLAPAGSGLASFSPDQVRHERIDSFTVEPAVARPGDRVTIIVRARLPFERGSRYRVYFDSSEPRLVKGEQSLKATGPPDPKTGVSTFQRVVTLSQKPRAFATELSPWISRDYQEIPVGWERKVLLQVVRSDREQAVAKQVVAGYTHLVQRDRGPAIEALRQATAQDPECALAYRYLGEACQEAGDAEGAADAFGRLVALAPDDLEEALPRYAEALLESGKTEAAAKALDAGAKRSKRLPARAMLARARLHARRGEMRAADEELASAGRRGRIPRAVQREIALRRAETALRAAPDSPDAELALARALADMERLEEARRHARRACELRPDEAWPLTELAEMEHRLGRDTAARATLERALALDPQNGDATLAMAELLLAADQSSRARELFRRAAELRPFDFRTRHGLALAELHADPTGSGWPSAAALEALRVAAVIGRGKGELDAGFEVPLGLFTMFRLGAKRLTVAGFSRQAAADDYLLGRALERIRKQPEDALAQFNAGTTLARLGEAGLSLARLDRAAALQPDLPDLPYWRAVALIGLHRPAEARQALAEAVQRNPLHPHARRLLARLALEAGEIGQAQAQLAAHRSHWPQEQEREAEVLE